MTARERPILFSAPMVRAILSGAKTQTRRIVKPQFAGDAEPAEMCATNEKGHQTSGHSGRWWDDTDGNEEKAIRCPFGIPGTKLWVRETWCDDWKEWRGIVYRADGGLDGDMLDAGCKWRPSIFMPRAASRITLEVTSVRVERLQDISVGDAIAEGIPRGGPENPDGIEQREYQALWESINGPGSWDANPFVWVIEFRRLA